MTLLLSLLKAALAFFGYLGIHYTFAWLLPLPTAGYTVCANLTAVAVSAAVFMMQKRRPSTVTDTRAMPWRHLFAAIGAGVGCCLLVRLMMLTVPFPESWSESYTARVEAVRSAPTWLMYLSSVIVAPFAEEWVFRGLLYRTLKNGMPRIAAMLLSSAVFALLHGTVMWMLYTFLLGMLLCVLYDRTRSLWACIACHTAFNIMGQIPFVGIVPDAVTIGIFAVGAAVFVLSVYVIYKTPQSHS